MSDCAHVGTTVFHVADIVWVVLQGDMEEGRHVFQEGNAFTLEALQHKVMVINDNNDNWNIVDNNIHSHTHQSPDSQILTNVSHAAQAAHFGPNCFPS